MNTKYIENLTQASRTMQAVCAVRVDCNKLLGDDPIASEIINQLPKARSYRDNLDQTSNGMFSRSIIIRTLYFSDILDREKDNFDQLVILSAGLDFRFFTYPEWRNKPIFLIDHPISLDLTTSLLDGKTTQRTNVRYLGIDFENISRSKLYEMLNNKGFDSSLKTLFLWQGSTFYLHPDAVYGVISELSNASRHNSLVVDFANSDSFMSNIKAEEIDSGVKETFKFLKKKGEAWCGFFKEKEVKDKLANLGYEKVTLEWDSDLENKYMNESLMSNKAMFYVSASK